MDVRVITEADVEHVVDLAREMHAAGSFSVFDFNDAKMRGIVSQAVADPKTVFCAIAEGRDGVIGGLLAHASSFFFGDDRLATDLGLFVKPTARGGMAAMRLYTLYEAWAREQGLVVSQVGVTAGIADATADRFYRKLGYEPIGTVYRKEIG